MSKILCPEGPLVKILTICRQSLVRSVSLADVLKLHFTPVDVIPVGIRSNSDETLEMLYEWADHIVCMQYHYKKNIHIKKHSDRALVCDVGVDSYGSSKHPQLLHQVWTWARLNQHNLGILEHKEKI